MFRKANNEEHNLILKSERRIYLLRVMWIVIFTVASIIPIILVSRNPVSNKSSQNTSTPQAVFDEQGEREKIIKELYGDVNEYVENEVFQNKKNYIDADKTRETGEIVYDEVALERYREQLKEEFYSNVSEAKIYRRVEQRRDAFNKSQITESTIKESNSMLMKFIFLFLALGVLLFAIVFTRWRSRFVILKNNNYEITEARIAHKEYLSRRDMFVVKRKAMVEFSGGTVNVNLPFSQAISLKVGTPVYLIHVGTLRKPYFVCRIN